jgi:hypothetical protein
MSATYYHRTNVAEAILSHGFRDSTGSYLFVGGFTMTGVFIANTPVGVNEGAIGDQVLRIDFPDDQDLDFYELVQEESTYREWCVPAALLNDQATLTLLSQSQADDLIAEHMRQVAKDPGLAD